MPSTRRGRPVRSSSAAKPAIIPACVEPVTVQTTIVSKKTPSCSSCAATSKAQLAKPSPPSGCSEAPAGMAYGLPPAASTSAIASSHDCRMPMSKPLLVEAHVGAHDPREQDVADLVVDRVVPVDPLLLDQPALQAEVRGDGRDLPGVVGLEAADRDERVGALGEHVGDDVLQLAGLVAAVRQARAAVLALGPHRRAAEMAVSRSSRWTGLGPKVSGCRGNSWSLMGRVVAQAPGDDGAQQREDAVGDLGLQGDHRRAAGDAVVRRAPGR